ncbi:MAG: ATP-dependent DNA helicase RecG [Parvularculaceae bacterium]
MRPTILNPLFADVTSLHGVGPRMAALITKVAGPRVVDVLFTPPHDVIDRSNRPKVMAAPLGALVTLEVTVDKHHPPPTRRRPYRVVCSDETGYVTLIFFHAKPDYLLRTLPEGARRIISGKMEEYDGGRQITHPDHIVAPENAESFPLFEPVYPLTSGLPASVMRKAAQDALTRVPRLPEWQDPAFLKKMAFPSWNAAITNIHTPYSSNDISYDSTARRRLAYDELLANQLALALVRQKKKKIAGRKFLPSGKLREKMLSLLSFELTYDQSKVLNEIDADMYSADRMTRLIQGDVGSGKTIVAFLAMLNAIETGAQCALLAPTEILVQQHFETMKPLAESIGIKLETLTGRDKGAVRRAKIDQLECGALDVIVGTHALIQTDVNFHDLGVIVIDEQHRFGVEQRATLTKKGKAADLLVMTATPIPRTLALTIYGDMDVSYIRNKPPGRLPIRTSATPIQRIDEVIGAVKRTIMEGNQVYWVCPLVEESELTDLTAASERHTQLQSVFFDRVGLIHGRMSSDEKDRVMNLFHTGKLAVLVATSVIEVGVNAPNATAIIIEHAERFGLSQLHQLRGRVGRGQKPASCVLLYKGPLSDTARARLEILRETEDGFKIAEEDLRLRGAGEALGAAQSGFPRMHFADYHYHSELISAARDDASIIVGKDPGLNSDRGKALKVLLYMFSRDSAVRLLRAG